MKVVSGIAVALLSAACGSNFVPNQRIAVSDVEDGAFVVENQLRCEGSPDALKSWGELCDGESGLSSVKRTDDGQHLHLTVSRVGDSATDFRALEIWLWTDKEPKGALARRWYQKAMVAEAGTLELARMEEACDQAALSARLSLTFPDGVSLSGTVQTPMLPSSCER